MLLTMLLILLLAVQLAGLRASRVHLQVRL
jgi:hypothetical protein